MKTCELNQIFLKNNWRNSITISNVHIKIAHGFVSVTQQNFVFLTFCHYFWGIFFSISVFLSNYFTWDLLFGSFSYLTFYKFYLYSYYFAAFSLFFSFNSIFFFLRYCVYAFKWKIWLYSWHLCYYLYYSCSIFYFFEAIYWKLNFCWFKFDEIVS